MTTLGVACFQDAGPVGASGSEASSEPSTGASTTGAATSASSATEMSTGTVGTATTADATTGSSTGAPCEAYYWTDFSADPGADWTVFSPSWLWDPLGGMYRGGAMGQAGAGAQLEAGAWQDFTLRVRLRLKATSFGGVVLRAPDQFMGDFLYLQLDSTDGDIEGFRANTMDAIFGFTGLVEADQWMQLVVQFQGTNLTLTLDGMQLANALQVQGLGMGRVGVIVLSGAMEIDELAVCPP